MAEDGQRASVDEQDGPAVGEDLSVPMWVWTLLGFAAVTAIVIVVIILGGRGNDGVTPAENEPTATSPAAEEPPADAASTQPA